MYTPQNQLHTQKVVTEGAKGFYKFAPTTAKDAPTGNWLAKVKVGGATFTKTVKIETIKPNRLKATLTFDQAAFDEGTFQEVLAAQWLHGAVAKELKADVQVKLLPTKTTFDAYPNYTFDDTGKDFYCTEQEIFKGNLDQQGRAFFSTKAGLEANPPGKVKAKFNIRIFEKGGGFSVDRTTFDYTPYRGYVGLQLPEG